MGTAFISVIIDCCTLLVTCLPKVFHVVHYQHFCVHGGPKEVNTKKIIKVILWPQNAIFVKSMRELVIHVLKHSQRIFNVLLQNIMHM